MKSQWWQREIIYQIYPKSFYDSNQDGIGDINGINEKLDYLHNLGVTMLWICPIFKSPMDDNGYDISDYYELAPEFGSIKDLENLIATAKEYNIKIILDLVINHTSDEHIWFQEAINNPSSKYHDYYIFHESKNPPSNLRTIFGGNSWTKVDDRDEYYFHAFGKKQPDLNWENPNVRQDLYKMVNYWLEKGIAGFRVDAITFIKKNSILESLPPDGADGLASCTKASLNQHGVGVFFNELKENTFDKFNCVTIAEAPGMKYDELEDFIGENGYFSMIFDFIYIDLDIDESGDWFKPIPWTIKDLREKVLKSQIEIKKHGWPANFLENHDLPRSTSKYLRHNQHNKDAAKMLGALYFFLRGTPFIYQGQELGMTNFERASIDEFNDISSIDQYQRSLLEGFTEEEALDFINLRSRDNSRTPFPWNSSTYGGFSTVKPWLAMNENYTQINVQNQLHDSNSILEFYKTMIKLRQNSNYCDCLIYGDIVPIDIDCDEVIAYIRKDSEYEIYCYFNFSQNNVQQGIPDTQTKVILNNLNEFSLINGSIILKPNQVILIAN